MFAAGCEEGINVIVRCEVAVAQEREDFRSAAYLAPLGDRVGLAEAEILRAVLRCVLLRLLLGQFDRVVTPPSATGCWLTTTSAAAAVITAAGSA
jgi:hypothetical protein